MAGAFSFDWGLVQPEVAQFTRICTYDPSGSVWSDPLPGGQTPPGCADRIGELRAVLRSARIEPPYVLVGYSIGALYARLYAAVYRRQVAGMVIVDHAFLDTPPSRPAPMKPSSGADTPPLLLSSAPISIDLADDSNFARLPQRNRDLHRWAMGLPLIRPTPESAAECESAIQNLTRGEINPLGTIPLVVISTGNDSPNYDALQKRLLSLSRTSRQAVASDSSHMVILDQPQIVIDSVRDVIDLARSH
jgi:pimeloyl-ACP methyl ester carboxylesterase